MKVLVSETELQQCGVSKEDLLQKFSIQLQKDFEQSNAVSYLKPVVDLDYDSIHRNVKQALEKLSPAEQMALLYRIDITETQIAKAMKLIGEGEEQQVIPDLIIKRVLQKVILKLIYSPKK